MKIIIDHLTIYEVTHILEYPKLKSKDFGKRIPDYRFQLFGRTLWGKLHKEGFYYLEDLRAFDYGLISSIRPVDEKFINSWNQFIEGEKVYHKPHIKLFYGSQHVATQYFDTLEELKDFKKEHNL